MYCKNSRRDDIIKACKYHYSRESGVDVATAVKAVMCVHNGIENISAYNACFVMNSEFPENEKFVRDLLDAIRMNAMLLDIRGVDVPQINHTAFYELILRVQIGRVTMSLPAELGIDSLPENDPEIMLAMKTKV